VTVEQFFHVCRSAAAIADTREVTVFGAAAIVPWTIGNAQAAPWPSLELDIDPGSPHRADLVDGSIGEGSLFAETFGIYAHGVGLEAFVAPPDWRDRSRVFQEPSTGVRVLTPHPLDLTIAKLVRGDPRDWSFAEYCVAHFGITADQIADGLRTIVATRDDYALAAAAAVLPMVSPRLSRK
jgi:hypothetical protein